MGACRVAPMDEKQQEYVIDLSALRTRVAGRLERYVADVARQKLYEAVEAEIERYMHEHGQELEGAESSIEIPVHLTFWIE